MISGEVSVVLGFWKMCVLAQGCQGAPGEAAGGAHALCGGGGPVLRTHARPAQEVCHSTN